MIHIEISDLLASGVHFGHKTRYWDPRMQDHIFTRRHGIHIIDLRKTRKALEQACQFVYQLSADKGKILFVGTKRSASKIIKEEAIRVEQPYVSHRWLGGMLTNYKTIRASIRRYQKLEKQSIDGTFAKLTKKEVLMKQREMAKLEQNIGGIKDMGGLPDALFVVDVDYENIAITEAKKIGLPIIGLVDTNSNPDHIDYVIPANDDAISSVRLLVTTIASAVEAGASEWKTTEKSAPRIKVTDKVKKLVEAQEKLKDQTKEVDRPTADQDQIGVPLQEEVATSGMNAALEQPRELVEVNKADQSGPESEQNMEVTKKVAVTKKPMAYAVPAVLVKELREKTGLGMMECKKALTESQGNIDQAIELLRKAGAMKAAKRADRIAAEGVIAARIAEDGSYGMLVEINTETDFVARDQNFLDFVAQVVDQAYSEKTATLEALMSDTLEQSRLALVQKTGENVSIRRVVLLEGERVTDYIHSNHRIGVLVAMRGGDEQTARDVAMHIAASTPLVVKPEQVAEDLIAREREIYMAQVENTGKPEDIRQKMVEGKLKKFLAEVSLTEQPFIRQPDKTVGKLLEEAKAEVIAFTRFALGEGIEKQKTDFAQEVASVVSQK